MKKFYMIYAEGGNSPTYKHETFKSAVDEAKRLCLLTNERTHILEVKQAYEPVQKIELIKVEK